MQIKFYANKDIDVLTRDRLQKQVTNTYEFVGLSFSPRPGLPKGFHLKSLLTDHTHHARNISEEKKKKNSEL